MSHELVSSGQGTFAVVDVCAVLRGLHLVLEQCQAAAGSRKGRPSPPGPARWLGNRQGLAWCRGCRPCLTSRAGRCSRSRHRRCRSHSASRAARDPRRVSSVMLSKMLGMALTSSPSLVLRVPMALGSQSAGTAAPTAVCVGGVACAPRAGSGSIRAAPPRTSLGPPSHPSTADDPRPHPSSDLTRSTVELGPTLDDVLLPRAGTRS